MDVWPHLQHGRIWVCRYLSLQRISTVLLLTISQIFSPKPQSATSVSNVSDSPNKHVSNSCVTDLATPADFDYELPDYCIAQTPLQERDQARMLVDLCETHRCCADTNKPGNKEKHCCKVKRCWHVAHHHVRDLPMFIRSGDVLVVNDTRVMPARLHLRRQSGGAVEVLLLENYDGASEIGSTRDSSTVGDITWLSDAAWVALVRPSKRVKPGEILKFAAIGAKRFAVEVGEDLGKGMRIVRVGVLGGDEFQPDHAPEVRQVPHHVPDLGEIPLPPYISSPIDDIERYQTVFGRRPSSTAAPTAGLHFTVDLLNRIQAAGAKVVSVELAIGLDTFRPITTEKIKDHVMHTERYQIPESTVRALEQADRVIAVGTTVVRTLETFALTGIREGRSSLFIRRPFEWKMVDMMLTNFHLPRSTLLCLVDAFVGSRWRYLYAEAKSAGYRFLSFGDAMLLSRRSHFIDQTKRLAKSECA